MTILAPPSNTLPPWRPRLNRCASPDRLVLVPDCAGTHLFCDIFTTPPSPSLPRHPPILTQLRGALVAAKERQASDRSDVTHLQGMLESLQEAVKTNHNSPSPPVRDTQDESRIVGEVVAELTAENRRLNGVVETQSRRLGQLEQIADTGAGGPSTAKATEAAVRRQLLDAEVERLRADADRLAASHADEVERSRGLQDRLQVRVVGGVDLAPMLSPFPSHPPPRPPSLARHQAAETALVKAETLLEVERSARADAESRLRTAERDLDAAAEAGRLHAAPAAQAAPSPATDGSGAEADRRQRDRAEAECDRLQTKVSALESAVEDLKRTRVVARILNFCFG